jgi:hypothetical protein
MSGRRMTSGVVALPTTGDGEGDAVYDSRSAPDDDGVERAVASTVRDTCGIEVCATLFAMTTGILAVLTAGVDVAPFDDEGMRANADDAPLALLIDSDALPADVDVARLMSVAVFDGADAGLRPCAATRWTTPRATALVAADSGNDGCAFAAAVPALACACVVARGGADAARAISKLAGAAPLLLGDAPGSGRRAIVAVARAVTSGVFADPLMLGALAGNADCPCVSLDARGATLDASGNEPRAPFAAAAPLVAARRCKRSTRPADATVDA